MGALAPVAIVTVRSAVSTVWIVELELLDFTVCDTKRSLQKSVISLAKS